MPNQQFRPHPLFLGKNDGCVSLMFEHDQREFLLCTLQHGKLYQQPLDLNFAYGENVTFYTIGKGTEHLFNLIVYEVGVILKILFRLRGMCMFYR